MRKCSSAVKNESKTKQGETERGTLEAAQSESFYLRRSVGGKLPVGSRTALFIFRPFRPPLHVIVLPLLPPSSSVLCYSGPSPIVVDVSCCHCVAKVGPHLEHITNMTQLACNHTNVLTSFL